MLKARTIYKDIIRGMYLIEYRENGLKINLHRITQ